VLFPSKRSRPAPFLFTRVRTKFGSSNEVMKILAGTSNSGAVVIVDGLKAPTVKVRAEELGGSPMLPVMEEPAEEPKIFNEPAVTVEPPLRYKVPAAPVATLPPSSRVNCERVWTWPFRFMEELALIVTLLPPMELGERKVAAAGEA